MLATGLFIAAICFAAENAPPSPDHIRFLQQAHAREHARAIRNNRQLRHRLPSAKPRTTLSAEERDALKAAVDRFARERAGEVVDLRKVQP